MRGSAGEFFLRSNFNCFACGPTETHVFIDGLANTGVQANTYKLSITIACCNAYLHHVKEIIDSGDRNFRVVPLVGDVGDFDVLPSLSTFLLVIVIMYTLWTRVDSSPLFLSFYCGEALSICCIIRMPMLLDMGPAITDIAAGCFCCPSYSVGRI